MTTRRGAIIGSVRTAATSAATPSASLSPRRHVAGVNALDVEGAQPFVDELVELRRQRRLLDVVFAEEQVERIRVAGLDLLADGGGVATGIGHHEVTKARVRTS